MDKIREIECFVSVVESGSFVRAADTVGVSKAAVSRAVLDLEARLSSRLLHRSTRRLSLTEAGQFYFGRCKQILDDLEQANDMVSGDAANPAGLLRVNAPQTFGVLHLAPLWPRFLQRFPGIRLDVSLSDGISDIVDEGYDLAIRIAFLQSSTLVYRRLATTHMVACAAPAYLAAHGTPAHPAELAKHTTIGYSLFSDKDEWHFDSAAGPIIVKTQPRMHANNGDTCLAAALGGLGIVLQPSFLAAPEIAAGRLVPLFGAYPLRSFGIYAVYPSHKHVPAKVRAMIDFLAASFATTDWTRPPTSPTQTSQPRRPA